MTPVYENQTKRSNLNERAFVNRGAQSELYAIIANGQLPKIEQKREFRT